MMENISYKEFNTLLSLFLDFGEAMLECGGEINRVEDSLVRMGTAYGATKTNVFVITSSIVLTMTFESGEEITQTRRILSSGSTDFDKLERLNELSRRSCSEALPVTELKKKLVEITAQKPSFVGQYLGSILAAGGFAVFFGGNLFDGIAAGVFAILICLLQNTFGKYAPNKVFFFFVCSLVTGIGIGFASKYIPVLNSDKVMIGDIMLLIPGIAITNAVRDMLVGDTISGAMKLVECLVWAGALATGFMLSMVLTGGMM